MILRVFGVEEAPRRNLHLKALGVRRDGEDDPDVFGQTGVDSVDQEESLSSGMYPKGTSDSVSN